MEKQTEKKEAKSKAPSVPTLGRIVHVRAGESWDAGIVTDEPSSGRFEVHVLGKHARVLSLLDSGVGQSWRWPPR